MEIDSQALTTCEVAPDGEAISLGFVDTSGNPATIRLPLNQASALAMTLPGLIDQALQTRLGDQSLRHAYPLASWVLEQSSDPTQNMVTLRTMDGFSICFSIARRQQTELGEALVAQFASKITHRANWRRFQNPSNSVCLCDPHNGTANAAEELGCSAVLHRSPSAGYVLVHVLPGTIREVGMGMYRSGQPGSSRPSPTTSPPKTPALSNGRALVVLIKNETSSLEPKDP